MAIKIKPSHKGLFHKDLGLSDNTPITVMQIKKKEHSKDPDVRKRAQFADNARKWNHGKKK